jgi:type II secretory pathway component GspD/PulD (secretin)
MILVAAVLTAALVGSAPIVGAETPSPPPLVGIQFENREIRSAAAAIAAKTGRLIALAPQLNLSEISFLAPEPVTRDELFRKFVVRLRELGCRTIEVGNVATIVPEQIVIPTPAVDKVGVNFERVDLATVAAQVGSVTGRVIAVAWGPRLPQVSWETEPVTPDELYRQFIATVERLGYSAVAAENVVTIVPSEALR